MGHERGTPPDTGAADQRREPAPTEAPVHALEAQRRANRDAARALGFEPYGHIERDLVSLAAAKARYDAAADTEQQTKGKEPGFVDRRPLARIAGRVMLSRDNGKLIWMNLRDESGDIQVAVSQKDCDEKGFALAKTTDLGDIVVVEGPVMKTKAGEITIWARSMSAAAKSLMPPPEKHAGLADPEIRYRRRYVDLYVNPETKRVFRLRSRVVSEMRRMLEERGYLEVETPMLQTLAGGAAARPFKTHMNALDINLYLRIAPELYLKRLLVGGFPRVYEINRNFRNEGLDRNHNPEFTMLEAYHAFGDVETVMTLTEDLARGAARVAAAERATWGDAGGVADGPGLRLLFGEQTIDYGSPFARVRYGDLFAKALGFPMTEARRTKEEAKARGFKHEGLDHWLIVNELFEEVAEPTLDHARPTFITDYPAAISPLTRPKRDDPTLADRADLFIGGMEIAPHYTELNDPDVQAAKFREQLAGLDDEESTFRNFDQDFIDALKVGMPPAGGMGLGVDRLLMLLANERGIRDVMLFPLMRPL